MCLSKEGIMKGEFCRVLTPDGIELQGFFVTPSGGVSEITVLHIHGLAGNFYENRFIDYIAEALSKIHINFLTFNNRGHDYIADFLYQEKDTGKITYKQIGAAFETFRECVLDIKAWIEFLKSRGSNKIIIQGHSHGAIKAVYYLSETQDSQVIGLILLSPSDDLGLQRSDLGEKFNEALEVAKKLVSEGREKELMPKEYFVYPISAKTYLDSFERGSPLGIFNLSRTDREEFPELQKIKVPVLVIIGTVEEAFLGEPQQFLSDLESLFKNTESFTGYVIEGAPHNYLGHEEKISEKIGQWVANCIKRKMKL